MNPCEGQEKTGYSEALEKDLLSLRWHRVSVEEMVKSKGFEDLLGLFKEHAVVSYRGESKTWFVTLTSFVSGGKRVYEGAFVHERKVFSMAPELALRAFRAAERVA
jgi:hypothetical protein